MSTLKLIRDFPFEYKCAYTSSTMFKNKQMSYIKKIMINEESIALVEIYSFIKIYHQFLNLTNHIIHLVRIHKYKTPNQANKNKLRN